MVNAWYRGQTNLSAGSNDENRKYLITTNNPMFTTRDLAHRLQVTGLDIDEDHIFTSALATALFLKTSSPPAVRLS